LGSGNFDASKGQGRFGSHKQTKKKKKKERGERSQKTKRRVETFNTEKEKANNSLTPARRGFDARGKRESRGGE